MPGEWNYKPCKLVGGPRDGDEFLIDEHQTIIRLPHEGGQLEYRILSDREKALFVEESDE